MTYETYSTIKSMCKLVIALCLTTIVVLFTFVVLPDKQRRDREAEQRHIEIVAAVEQMMFMCQPLPVRN